MSDREGTPQNQHNGPVQDPIPHSGRHHGEKNVHDFRKPDGSIMSIKDAVKGGKFRKPDGSPYTVEEVMSMLGSSEPIGLAPDSIADHTDPAGPKTEAYTPMIETGKKRSWRRWVAGAIGGAVLIGGAGYGVSKATGGDGQANPQPTVTGPATAGTPSAHSVKTNPSDPESEISQGAKTEQEKQLELRQPWYEAPITSVDFTKLLVSDSTRRLLAQENGFTYQEASAYPMPDAFPNRAQMDSLSIEQINKVRDEVNEAYKLLPEAIELSNKTYGTDYKLEDFVVTQDEIPAARTDANKTEVSAFLANKIVGIGLKLDTLAAAMRHQEYSQGLGLDTPPEKLRSTKLINMSHFFTDDDRKGALDTNTVVGRHAPEDFQSESVVPTSTLLITNVGGTPEHDGFQLEKAKDNLKDLYLPMLGIYAQVNRTSGTIGEGGVTTTNYPQQLEIDYYTLSPLDEKVDGKAASIPLSLGSKLLKLVG